MALNQFTRKTPQQTANQDRITIANLAGFWRLSRRDDFVTGGEMKNMQTPTDQWPDAANRRKQGEFAGVQIRTGLNEGRAGFPAGRGGRC